MSGIGLDLPSSGSSGDSSAVGEEPQSRRRGAHTPDPLRIEVPFEIVVVCERNGVVLQPGGYRLTARTIKARKDLFVEQVQRLVQQRAQVDPLIRLRPKVHFLVKSGGSEMYQVARRQWFAAGPQWPVSLQVAEANALGTDAQEILR
jgi:hypothetical protein